MNGESRFLEAQVFHSRSETAANAFKYPVLNIFFSVDEVATLRLIFGKRFFGLLAFRASDYLLGADDLSADVRKFAFEKFNYSADRVFLQTIPRMLGYVFNPVSFWYFFRGEKLEAVLCEVNNTFGERHFYWLHQGGEDLNGKWLESKKEFHVSPFFNVDGIYTFRFLCTERGTEAHIRLLDEDRRLRLNTWIKGDFRRPDELGPAALLRRYGWMTPLVVLRIHFQAVKLFLKKVRFYRKPAAPERDVTTNGT